MRRAALVILPLAAVAIGNADKVKGSSHAEAPAIAQDPQVDNTNVWASKAPPTTITVLTGWNPLPNPRPDQLRYLVRQRPLRDPHRQQQRRRRGRDLPVPVQEHLQEGKQLPEDRVGDRRLRVADLGRRSEPEPPDLLGDEGHRAPPDRPADGRRHGLPGRAAEHRPEVHAELREHRREHHGEHGAVGRPWTAARCS